MADGQEKPRPQNTGVGPALSGARAAHSRPPEPDPPDPTSNILAGSSSLESNAASAPLHNNKNNSYSCSSLYPEGRGSKADIYGDYLSLKQQQSDRKDSMCSKNRLSVSVQNTKRRPDGSLENPALTHQNLFEFLVNNLGMDMEQVVAINCSQMSSFIHNNLLKHLSFVSEEYNTEGFIGDHFYRGH